MGKKRMVVLGVLITHISLFTASVSWAAWGKEEPKDQASDAVGTSTSSRRTESAAVPVPAADFKMVEDLAKNDPAFALDMYRMAGERYLNRHKPTQAAALLAEASKMAPGDEQIKETLADAQFSIGQNKEAMATWDQILADRPKEIGVRLRYASFLEKTGDGAKSIETIRELLVQHPEEISLRYWIADAYTRQGKSSDAVKELQAMLKTLPKEEVEIKRRINILQPPAPPKQEAQPAKVASEKKAVMTHR